MGTPVFVKQEFVCLWVFLSFNHHTLFIWSGEATNSQFSSSSSIKLAGNCQILTNKLVLSFMHAKNINSRNGEKSHCLCLAVHVLNSQLTASLFASANSLVLWAIWSCKCLAYSAVLSYLLSEIFLGSTKTLEQGSSILSNEIHFPAEISSDPNQIHLIIENHS